MELFDTSQIFGILAGFGIAFFIFMGLLSIFMIVATWVLFEKAGQPGWAILIPIYNLLIFLKVAGKPWWWIFGILLPIIPILGIIVYIVWWILILHGISKKFGKDGGFTVGLLLLGIVFFPILAFGKAEYQAVEEAPAAE